MDANITIDLLSRTPSPSVLALQLEWIKCAQVGPTSTHSYAFTVNNNNYKTQQSFKQSEI